MKLCLFLLFAASALAADVTGTWSGTITVSGGNGDEGRGVPAYAQLTQKGSELTGSVGQDENETYPIRNGTVDGAEVRFEVAPGNAVMKFVLHVNGDEMKGTVSREDNGETTNATIVMKRQVKEGAGPGDPGVDRRRGGRMRGGGGVTPSIA